jgi:hypothetical protein
VYFVLVLIIVLWAAMPLSVAANEVLCTDSKIVVVTKTQVDQKDICFTVRKTLIFLESIGLKLNGSVTIKLIDRFEGNASVNAIGQYDSRSHEISLLNYDAALTASLENPAFHTTMSRALWLSYVSHELAHAAALEHFDPGVKTFTASEYIAAITQLAMLSQTTRERIFQNYSDTEAFDDEYEISGLFYLMDPSMFAVKDYLHYLKPANGSGFINRLIHQGLVN